MDTKILKLTVLALLVFSISQMFLVRRYDQLNQQLQDALSSCAGITKVQ